MQIPCSHMEALGNKATTSIGAHYLAWLDEYVAPCYHIDKIVTSLQDISPPLNPSSYEAGAPLQFPRLTKTNRPSKAEGRYLAFYESSTLPSGQQRAGQRPPKRKLECPIATSAQQALKKAEACAFFMIKYRGSNNSSARFSNGGVLAHQHHYCASNCELTNGVAFDHHIGAPDANTFRPIMLLRVGASNKSCLTLDGFSREQLHAKCLLTNEHRSFYLDNCLDAIMANEFVCMSARDGSFIDTRVPIGRTRLPSPSESLRLIAIV
jgi:hypothetical protein